MKIEIKASPKEVKDGHFDYSNMESEYGCNTLYFTKNDLRLCTANEKREF